LLEKNYCYLYKCTAYFAFYFIIDFLKENKEWFWVGLLNFVNGLKIKNGCFFESGSITLTAAQYMKLPCIHKLMLNTRLKRSQLPFLSVWYDLKRKLILSSV